MTSERLLILPRSAFSESVYSFIASFASSTCLYSTNVLASSLQIGLQIVEQHGHPARDARLGMMGHLSITVTQRYIDPEARKTADAMNERNQARLATLGHAFCHAGSASAAVQ